MNLTGPALLAESISFFDPWREGRKSTVIHLVDFAVWITAAPAD